MIEYFYSTASRKNITPVVVYVATANNPADLPSRVKVAVVGDRRAKEGQCDLFFSVAAEQSTLDEVVDFWSKMFRYNMPDKTIPMW